MSVRVKMTTLCYIEKDHKILMLRRDKKEQDQSAGKWIGVGGKMEAGESPAECMLREVREETGLELTSWKLRGVISFMSDIWEDEYMMLYSADEFTGELVEECSEGTLRWIDRDQIMDLSLWEGDRLFLKRLLESDELIQMKLIYEGEKLVSWQDI